MMPEGLPAVDRPRLPIEESLGPVESGLSPLDDAGTLGAKAATAIVEEPEAMFPTPPRKDD